MSQPRDLSKEENGETCTLRRRLLSLEKALTQFPRRERERGTSEIETIQRFAATMLIGIVKVNKNDFSSLFYQDRASKVTMTARRNSYFPEQSCVHKTSPWQKNPEE